eukprot:6220704-Pyramimonas_sp.AAC.1
MVARATGETTTHPSLAPTALFFLSIACMSLKPKSFIREAVVLMGIAHRGSPRPANSRPDGRAYHPR